MARLSSMGFNRLAGLQLYRVNPFDPTVAGVNGKVYARINSSGQIFSCYAMPPLPSRGPLYAYSPSLTGGTGYSVNQLYEVLNTDGASTTGTALYVRIIRVGPLGDITATQSSDSNGNIIPTSLFVSPSGSNYSPVDTNYMANLRFSSYLPP